MSASITETVIRQQLSAMGSGRFEVGVMHKDYRMVLRRDQSVEQICKCIRWLRRENTSGAHIFVRAEWPHALSLIDDVGADTLEEMDKMGFEPVVVVETSPDNFQVWLNHGRVLSGRFLSTLVARQLASRFGGDRGSSDWRHFGRLAGFTNQKKERRLDSGLQPFVKLRCCEGRVYSRAAEFLREVEALKRALLSQRELRKLARPWQSDGPVRAIASFHADSRYAGDLHRADMAWALHAAAHGLSREQIEHEILNSRDLSKKGPCCAGWHTPSGPRARPSLCPRNKRAFAVEN
jgi:DNA primase RepB-like protein